MTISVSVLSHAFFTEKASSRAISTCSQCPCDGISSNTTSEQQADMKIDNVTCECVQSQDAPSSVTTSGNCSCREFLMSPRSAMTSLSPRMITGASPSPRSMTTANPSSRTGSSKSQGRKKNHKKRGGRRRGVDGGAELKEPKIMQTVAASTENRDREGAELGSCTCCGNRVYGYVDMLAGSSGTRAIGDVCGGEGKHMDCVAGGGCGSSNEVRTVEVDVMVHKVREECSLALGIVKEDLELFGLCHIPASTERAKLLKDKSGTVHLGVMVRNSDLNLQSIEELVVNKDKAEQEAENYRLQVSEKSQDFNNLKLKYEKLTEEVLRLRTMVNRANHLRRESEKATEVLRVEFEKLVKDHIIALKRTTCRCLLIKHAPTNGLFCIAKVAIFV